MESMSCVRAVVAAAGQYQSYRSEATLTHLERQLDVLISITEKGNQLAFFDLRQLLPVECISCLVSILNHPVVKSSLLQKVFLLLHNLAHDDGIRQALSRKFHVTSCLAYFLVHQETFDSEKMTIQCAQLLRNISYNFEMSANENYANGLVRFLMRIVQNKETELTQPCLGILANLCFNNPKMHHLIKSQEKLKPFYKSLMGFLSHHNLTTVVFSMSVLASLFLHDELGCQVFNSQNIHQTFQLMFNILLNGGSKVAWCYAVDTFATLLQVPRIQVSLKKYSYLETCLKQLLPLLNKKDNNVSKLLELLVTFCDIQDLRPTVTGLLLKDANSGLNSLLGWLGEDLLGTTQALRLLLHVCQETMCTEDYGLIKINEVMDSLKLLLSRSADLSGQSPAVLLDRQTLALQIIYSLAAKFEKAICSSIDVEVCRKMVDDQFLYNPVGIKGSFQKDCAWSTSGVFLVINCLELLLRLKDISSPMQALFVQLMQNDRVVAFLSGGLTSRDKQLVHSTLSLVRSTITLQNFPIHVLSDSISSANCAKISSTDSTSEAFAPIPIRVLGENKENAITPLQARGSKSNTSVSSSSALDKSVQSLIDRMHSGLELSDLRSSEIFSMYEHKIQSLQNREHELQELVETKTAALAQADRILSQYRCRQAQSDAETQNLLSLVRDAEQRWEESSESAKNVTADRERLTAELEQLNLECSRLEAVAEEHKELTQSFEEQKLKLETAQRSLTSLRQDHETLTGMHDMLRRHNDSLKQQLDNASQQLLEIEDERKNLSRTLKEKETKLSELTKTAKRVEESLRKTSRERDDLEAAIDKLRTELSKVEQSKKELQHQVSTLEVVCQQRDASILEKDHLISQQKSEIDKHTQIAALIQQLSSGNAPPNLSCQKK